MFLGASAASECAETEHPVLPWLPLSCRAAAALISPLSLFQEQGGFFFLFFFKHFCSHPGGLCSLTRWKMLPHHLNPLPRSWSPPELFFFVVRGNLLFFFLGPFYKSPLFEIHVASLARVSFVVVRHGCSSFRCCVSCEGRSPNGPGVNPIVFSPM